MAPSLQMIRGAGMDNGLLHVPTVGTGSNRPGAMAPRDPRPPQPSYGGMDTPSVWRTNRTTAAAKVDALASGGMDDFEIPAFLRKQAD